jgi:hypothetical protein
MRRIATTYTKAGNSTKGCETFTTTTCSLILHVDMKLNSISFCNDNWDYVKDVIIVIPRCTIYIYGYLPNDP